MKDKIRQLRQKREKLIKDAKAIIDAADEEKRALTEDEEKQWNDLIVQADALAADIGRRERQDSLDRDLELPANDPIRPDPEQDDPRIGMSREDIRKYSLVRAIKAAANNDWRGAELEREASEAVAQRLGRAPSGFFVPFDWMAAEARDLIKGTAAQGGYLVATDLLAQSFIELLRNKMVVQQAGAFVMTGLVGDVAIPRQTGGATAYWVAESGAPTESQQAFDQVPLTPKTVGAFTDISRKLLLQASLDVERFVRNDLTTVLALAIDLASLHGSGAGNEPTGIANQTGVAVVAIGANGGAPLWTHIIQLETEVAQDNADIGALGYISNAKVRGKLKETEKATGTAQFVWQDDRQNPLNGYRALVTNQVRSDLTKGTGSNLSAIFFGNWSDLIIGQWGSLDILVDPYTGGTSGTVRVIALQDVDIAVRHPESFSVVLDADTT